MNFNQFFNEIMPRASAFLGVFFIVMLIGYGFLYFIDFVPEEPTEEATNESRTDLDEDNSTDFSGISENALAETDEVNGDKMPISIHFPSLNKSSTVLNPTSRSYEDLDAALLKGVVRHPDSADLGDKDGNMLILGHSSYLNTVFNKNFQAFNGIQNLTWGDTITVKSSDAEYTYQVDRVYQAKASAITIPVKSNVAKLTLATCNTFGAKEDRFIVEATLVAKKAL